MSETHRDDQERLLGLAAAYSLGALDPAERVEFEAGLSLYPELRTEVQRYGMLLSPELTGQAASSPSPAGRDRLLAHVRESERRFDPDRVRWEPVEGSPEFELCWLDQNESTGALTVLLKGPPGARYPDHSHPGGEEFFVLSGSFADHRAEYRTGDSHAFPPGSVHRDLRVTGSTLCIILVMTGPGGIEWTTSEDGA